MGAKEDLLMDLIRKDPSGGVEQIHARLVNYGLKWKGPSNSQTLLYYFRHEGKEIGVAAMRQSIFSFPAAFWRIRPGVLRRAVERVPSYHLVNPEPAISTSQYSAGQIRISQATTGLIEDIIESIIIPESRNAGAQLA
jgi:hypothetical protein